MHELSNRTTTNSTKSSADHLPVTPLPADDHTPFLLTLTSFSKTALTDLLKQRGQLK